MTTNSNLPTFDVTCNPGGDGTNGVLVASGTSPVPGCVVLYDEGVKVERNWLVTAPNGFFSISQGFTAGEHSVVVSIETEAGDVLAASEPLVFQTKAAGGV